MRNVEVVRRLMEAFEAGDREAQLALMHRDVELREWPDTPDSRTYRGHDGMIAAAQSWAEAWEWLRTEVDEYVEAGDRVLVRGHTHGKGKGSGVEVDIDAFYVYTLRDGKVTRMEMHTTEEPALHAAGLSEGQEAG